MVSDNSARGRPAGRTGEDLVAVAREVFLERGYDGTSMDEVARRAKISKASLYREHASKSALYAAVVRQWAAAGRDSMRPALERLMASADIRQGLTDLAEAMLAGILSPAVLAMRRLVASEARSQPEVAETYLTESWHSNIRGLAEALRVIAADERLRIDDPVTAAEQFTWLVIGAPLNARMLGVDGGVEGPATVRAVDLFLAGYAVR